jgi:nicotinamidase-related amidase
MIERFGAATALLLIDVQKGVDVLDHWGGSRGRRNNPKAEDNLHSVLDAWRQSRSPVFFTVHDSREERSPLKLSLPTGAFKDGLEPRKGETVVRKDVNSGFIGTNLELMLQREKIHRLVIAGFFTNMCVETTVRMAGNLGFDTYLVADACATTNRVGPDGIDRDADLVHAMSIASMDGEFCTAINSADVLKLLKSDVATLVRRQGNE